jgi:hypothetical protein
MPDHTDLKDCKRELRHQRILIEDIDSTLAIILELLAYNLDFKNQLAGHDSRLEAIESRHP